MVFAADFDQLRLAEIFQVELKSRLASRVGKSQEMLLLFGHSASISSLTFLCHLLSSQS